MEIKFTPRRVLTTMAVIVVLVAAADWYAGSHFSFHARFSQSKGDLEAYAAEAMKSDPAGPLPKLPHRLGTFTTYDEAERLPYGFLFFCDYGHPLEKNGIAYSTEPLPHDPENRDVFTHIEGNWYAVWRNR